MDSVELIKLLKGKEGMLTYLRHKSSEKIHICFFDKLFDLERGKEEIQFFWVANPDEINILLYPIPEDETVIATKMIHNSNDLVVKLFYNYLEVVYSFHSGLPNNISPSIIAQSPFPFNCEVYRSKRREDYNRYITLLEQNRQKYLSELAGVLSNPLLFFRQSLENRIAHLKNSQ